MSPQSSVPILHRLFRIFLTYTHYQIFRPYIPRVHTVCQCPLHQDFIWAYIFSNSQHTQYLVLLFIFLKCIVIHHPNMSRLLRFSLNYFSLNSLNSVTKICHYSKGIRTWLTQPPLVWETSMQHHVKPFIRNQRLYEYNAQTIGLVYLERDRQNEFVKNSAWTLNRVFQ